MFQFLIPLGLVALLPPPAASVCNVKACYYRNDAAVRPKRFQVLPEQLWLVPCTHLVYAFAHIVDNKLKASLDIDEDTPTTQGMYSRFNNLKEQYGHVSLLSVGGPRFGSEKFSEMSSTRENRKAFIDHAVTFLRHRRFDGLDLYWVFPAAKDRDKFSLLVQELKSAFDEEAKSVGTKRLLLTAALPGDVVTYFGSYDVDKIMTELDLMTIMAFDLGIYQGEPFSHPSRIVPDTPEDKLNLDYAMKHYVKMGVPKAKLLIGLPMYGWGYVRGWTSLDGKDQFTEPSHAIKERGVVAYFQVCQMVELGRRVGRTNGSPYLSHDLLWIGYDDANSVSEKSLLALRRGLAGVMLWSLDMDDVTKQWCTGYAYNLIESVNKACENDVHETDADFPFDSKDPKSIWNLENNAPAVGKSQNFTELSKRALDDLCQGVPGEKQIDYPESKCHLYVHCKNGTGEIGLCPFLQTFHPVHKHCDFFDLISECQ